MMNQSSIIFTLINEMDSSCPNYASLFILNVDQKPPRTVKEIQLDFFPLIAYPVAEANGFLILGKLKDSELELDHFWFSNFDGSQITDLGNFNLVSRALLIDYKQCLIYLTVNDIEQGIQLIELQIPTGKQTFLGATFANNIYLLDQIIGQNVRAFSSSDYDLSGSPKSKLLIQENYADPWTLFEIQKGRPPLAGAFSYDGKLFATTINQSIEVHGLILYETEKWKISYQSTQPDLNFVRLAWSSNGHYLASTAHDHSDKWNLLLYDRKIKSSSVVPLNQCIGGELTAPRWTPDGQAVFLGYKGQKGKHQLLRVSGDGIVAEVPLPFETCSSFYFIFSKKGDYLLLWDYSFDLDSKGSHEVFLLTLENGIWENLSKSLLEKGYFMFPQWINNPLRFEDLPPSNDKYMKLEFSVMQ